MDPVERIDQAFLQLEFAIKLMNYIELKKLNKNEFDTNTIILLDGEALRFNHNSFNSYEDIILAAQNNYVNSLGLSAIALEKSLQDAGIRNDPKDMSNEGQLRKLVYMIRCAFAHDMMTPHWDIKRKNTIMLEVNTGKRKISVDLNQLDGKPFDDKNIGGMGSYYEIKDAVKELIRIKRSGLTTG